MKCPKCGVDLLDHVSVCPFCKTPIVKETEHGEAQNSGLASQSTGRYSAIDPNRDSYDFDLQYTLTFRDSGEIKQAIEDMESGITRDRELKISDSGKKPEHSRYTLEEMQAAALRAQQRRERRSGGKRAGGESKPRVTSAEKRKQNALRSAKPKAERSSADKPARSRRGLLIGTGVLAVVIALIVGVVNICAYFMHQDPEYPTVYTKGNELYLYYGGREELLTSNFITTQPEPSGGSNSAGNSSSGRGGSSAAVTDPKTGDKKALTEKDLIKVSESGAVTYFFENVNMNTKTGNLVYYENGKKKSRTVLAQNVYYDIELGNDGASVMYVKNTDNDGMHGELCYWKPEMKEQTTVEMDIGSGNFALAQDCMSATYIKNFNPTVHTGDLCYVSFAEGAEPSKRVDEKVAFVFGTTPKSKTYFYAKNYDTKTGSYDLYIQSDTEGPKMLAEKGLLAPVISGKNESAFLYSNYRNNFQTLSYVDLAAGVNTKLEDEMTEIIRVRRDDGAVIYSKSYETDKADYYYVNAKSPNPQTVATAINTAAVKAGTVAFDASDDFSKIAYIGGFDTAAGRGALYTMSVINDYAGSEMRISDDAYSCDVSSDGAVVRFATSYNAETNTVNLVSHSNSNTLGLADKAAVGAFTFDKTGEYAIYAKDVNADTVVGRIESVNKKARIKELDTDVHAYGLKKDGTVLLLKTVGEGDNQTTSLYRTTLKGGSVKLQTEGISRVLLY